MKEELEDDFRDMAYVLAILRCDPLDPRWDVESAPFVWRNHAVQALRGIERSDFFQTHPGPRYFVGGPTRILPTVPVILRGIEESPALTWLDLAEEQERCAEEWTRLAAEQPTERLRRAMIGDAADATATAIRYRAHHAAGDPLSQGLAVFMARAR